VFYRYTIPALFISRVIFYLVIFWQSIPFLNLGLRYQGLGLKFRVWNLGFRFVIYYGKNVFFKKKKSKSQLYFLNINSL
jgi:hypothetical protein